MAGAWDRGDGQAEITEGLMVQALPPKCYIGILVLPLGQLRSPFLSLSSVK